MADYIINEVLYFVNCHFRKVRNDSIITCISTFYNEDELVKAKATIDDVCVKLVTDGSILRIIARKGDNKHHSDAKDIIKFLGILGEHKIVDVLSLSKDCKKMSLINPWQVDHCFMLDIIDDSRRKVESLCDLKKEVQNLGDKFIEEAYLN